DGKRKEGGPQPFRAHLSGRPGSLGLRPSACQPSKIGERTGSRPSAAAGGGASRASLEAGRSTVYFNTVALFERGATRWHNPGENLPPERGGLNPPGSATRLCKGDPL